MNIVKFDFGAFVLPDELDAFMKRYGVDALYLDGEEGVIYGIGPNDKEWRELPDSGTNGIKVVSIRSKE